MVSHREDESGNQHGSGKRISWILPGILCAGFLIAGLILWKSVWIEICQWQASRNLQSHHTTEALSWIQQAYELDRQNAETLLTLARAQRRTNQVEDAVETLKKLFQLSGQTEELQREQWLVEAQVGDLKNLEQHLADMLIDPRGNAADICETFVNSCILNYRFADAQRVIEVWQADFPEDPLPHYYQGRILEHQGNWNQAESEFNAALKLSPEHIPSAYNLARIKLSQNQVDAALEIYQRCLQQQHQHAAALLGMARCLSMQQDVAAARKILNQVQQMPENQIMKDFREVGDPAYAARNAVALQRGQLELSAGNYQQAITNLETAVSLNPKDRKARLSLADAYRGLGELKKAEVQLQVIQKSQAAITRLDECFDLLQKDLTNAELRAEIGEIFLEHISENQGIVWLKNALYYDADNQRATQALKKYYEQLENEKQNQVSEE